jgi:nitrogen fixation protein NifU and related proteins
MLDLRELYQEVILDHNKHPRNAYKMTDASCHAEGFNPLCGDHLTLYLHIEDNIITAASFEGNGCAISTASASLMTEYLKNKTCDEAQQLFESFHNLMMLDRPLADEPTLEQQFGKLTVLAGVREFPARVKCATLAWHTLKAALTHQNHPVSTE